MRKDLTGKTYSGLTVIGYDCFKSSKNHWWCKCICGKTISVAINNLNRGQKSCGCLHKEWVGNMARKHGESRSAIYRIYAGIKTRCYNKNSEAYPHYGGRGIKMSVEWFNSFEQFRNDMGERPKNHCVERIDNDKGYCKENCKWATVQEQSLNKRGSLRTMFNGEMLSIKEISKRTGFSYETLSAKFRKGEDISKIKYIKPRKWITAPVIKIEKLLKDGKTVAEIADVLKVPLGSISYRVKRYINKKEAPYWGEPKRKIR